LRKESVDTVDGTYVSLIDTDNREYEAFSKILDLLEGNKTIGYN
jgi:hypothetical protein